MGEEKLFYSIGEFARLCGTTRDTLVHYDNIGLVTPDHVGENGYRYYSYTQSYTLVWIRYMQALGFSLHDMKAFVTQGDMAEISDLMEGTADAMEKRIRRDQLLLRCVRKTEKALRERIPEVKEKPYIRHMEEQFLITSMPHLAPNERVRRMEYLNKFIDEIMDKALIEQFYLGTIISQDRVEQGIFSMNCWYTPVCVPVDCDRLHIKPKGEYAIYNHHGRFDELPQSYDTLLAFIEEEGYKVAGDLYEADFPGVWPGEERDSYNIKFMIRVEKK